MTTLGIIGSGNIGAAIARLAVATGVSVLVSNSRGPQSLDELTAELGPLAKAGTVEEAASAGELVVLSVPLRAHTAVAPGLLAGKIVLDTSNYYPSRDGRIAELDDDQLTTSELVRRHFDKALMVKAFSNILAQNIPQLARPDRDVLLSPPALPEGEAISDLGVRTALPIAGDDAGAKTEAASLVDRLGFDVVDAGSLADSWRFEPDTAAYTRLYLADPNTPDENIFEALGRPVSEAELRDALQRAERVHVGNRAF